MKKIVCEICESQKIRKENGIFVCQECGTEYSSEEAKKLLKEIDDNCSDKRDVVINDKNKGNLNIGVGNNDVRFLAQQLKTWGTICLIKEQINKFYLVKDDNKFWDARVAGNLSTPEKTEFLENYPVDTNQEEKMYLKSLRNDNKFMVPLKEIKRIKDIKYEYGSSSYLVRVEFPQPLYRESLHDCIDESDTIYYGLKKIVDRYQKYNFMPKLYGHGILENETNQLKYLLSRITESKNIRNKKIGLLYSEFVTMCRKLNDKHAELVNASTELEKIFLLPIKYRNSVCISRMLDILNDGRALDWKELVNLYETIKFREDVTSGLDSLCNSLKNINITLLKGFTVINENLCNINDNICTLSTQVNKLFEEANNIKEITKVILINDILNN